MIAIDRETFEKVKKPDAFSGFSVHAAGVDLMVST